MDEKHYVSLEIAGPMAMFTRPDSGAAPVSYPTPTYSASKGIFESVAWYRNSAYIKPIKVEICRPIRFQKYTTNYGGPLRKGEQIKKGASYQLPAVVLVDVCYRIYGEVVEFANAPNGNNHLHALQSIFLRRLAKGQFYYTPFLGWKEFTPSYAGFFRKDTQVESGINLVISSMLISPFNSDITPKNTQMDNNSRYAKNVAIENGVLDYTN
jgi:CRISPR-associated protein Cas5d